MGRCKLNLDDIKYMINLSIRSNDSTKEAVILTVFLTKNQNDFLD